MAQRGQARRILSVLLCGCLVAGTLFFSERLSGAVLSAYAGIFRTGEQMESIRASLSEGLENLKQTGVLTGFGNGGVAFGSTKGVPKDVAALMTSAATQYAKLPKSGKIVEEQFGEAQATAVSNGVTLSNKTEVQVNLGTVLSAEPAALKKVQAGKPAVLIFHTHTTEGYELLDVGWYSESYNSRTEDPDKSVVRVGTELASVLTEKGISVIHDTEIYDRTYSGAYDRSRKAVEAILKENPSIVITLDVHRDAIHYGDATKGKPTAVIDGKKAAQVMIITGCEGDGVTDFPGWRDNLTFAALLQKEALTLSPGLMRPIFFCHRKYNMDVTPCSLLLEFGTDASTLDEAVYSGRLIGEALAEMVKKY